MAMLNSCKERMTEMLALHKTDLEESSSGPHLGKLVTCTVNIIRLCSYCCNLFSWSLMFFFLFHFF